jgi:CxxC motif-containing protein (DUF1111 family)
MPTNKSARVTFAAGLRVVQWTARARRGSALFDRIGCSICHVRTLTTMPDRTAINAGTFTVTQALGDKQFHPFGDFLLHDIGTGDGIVMAWEEYYGPNVYNVRWKDMSASEFQRTANKIRTAPLWGVRMRVRLMHDGASVTLVHAIARHRGEASHVAARFMHLSTREQNDLLQFLKSL